MAPTRDIAQEQPLPISTGSRDQFVFPKDRHLLITTPSQICSWDSTGIRTVFTSNKNSIAAATEALDESGIIAVADKHVVVLHDTKRGREKSWGLEASDDQVRHLQYTADAKSLFLSTTLTENIQWYSVERGRLLNPATAHASPPVALAVSPSGHLLVSASDNPPVVYLKNLTHNTAPVLIEPRASKAAVTVAVFHPERDHIFLLAFRDGSAAAFDANKIIRSGKNTMPDQESVNKCEISHLSALHRAAPVQQKLSSITDAAFLPGFKTRAVTVGSDGRCRIVDFADGGVIVRTWHAKAPVASVSVLSLNSGQRRRNRSDGSAESRSGGRSTTSASLIAIGRADGLIHIYDSLGLLLSERSSSEKGEKIISIKWAPGPSPKPILERAEPTESAGSPGEFSTRKPDTQQTNLVPTTTSLVKSTSPSARRETMFEHVGLPPALRKPKSPNTRQTPSSAPRQFTVHPDELEESTVRRNVLLETSKIPPPTKGDYLDLFSPVRPAGAEGIGRAERRMASPPRSRPAITSQTFVKSPEAEAATKEDRLTRQRNLALFPSTDSGSETVGTTASVLKQLSVKTAPKTTLPQVQKKRITFKDHSRRNSRRSSGFKAATAPANSNAKVFADIRKLSTVHPALRPQGALPIAGPEKLANDGVPSNGTKVEDRHGFMRRTVDHIETHLGSEEAREAYERAHSRRHWPEDSTQEPEPVGDIWLTSESDGDARPSRRSKKHHSAGPPPRQTSRSRVDSKGTMSTIAQYPADSASAPAQRLHRMDGSTEEEMFSACTHITSNGTLTPSSADIQNLFPRISSLSPRKRRKSEKRIERSPKSQNKNLREVAPNIAGRIAKSPWERARARAGKVARNSLTRAAGKKVSEPIEVFYDPECAVQEQRDARNTTQCTACDVTKAKVQELEAQVSRLKGEILVCKAMLRRQGVLLPGNLQPR